ncbi:hypothetical protein KXX47_000617, partial [Aspergillus fumigatus]
LVKQRDCETWHHCVKAGGSLEIAALNSVGFADFQDIIFDVQSPNQETALKLFDVLCEKHTPGDGDKKLPYEFCSAAKEWLAFSVKYKFRQLSEAIVHIHGMEELSFREAIVNAAVVNWDDLFQEWLEREEEILCKSGQHYQFAQYLCRSLLHYNSSLSFSQIEIMLGEIRTNSTALSHCDRMLVGRRDRIIKDIQETRARDESASIADL